MIGIFSRVKRLISIGVINNRNEDYIIINTFVATLLIVTTLIGVTADGSYGKHSVSAL